jgi:hypothetical protein
VRGVDSFGENGHAEGSAEANDGTIAVLSALSENCRMKV